MTAWDRLLLRLAEVHDLEQVAMLLEWDEQVSMPPLGNRARGEQLETVSRLAHRLFTADEVGELLDGVEAEVSDPLQERVVRATRRAYTRARRLPTNLYARLARARSEAYTAWLAAREERSFSRFAAAFQTLLSILTELTSEIPGAETYDRLLDFQGEVGLCAQHLDELFQELRPRLLPLVETATLAGDASERRQPLQRVFPLAQQETLNRLAATVIGFDNRRGRLDYSVHPFTTSFDPDDVRITTRLSRGNLASGLFATLHEAGHALYEQGLPREGRRTPLCRPISTGVHESQSRLWENQVGRSLAFWRFFLPLARSVLPGLLDDVDAWTMVRAVNVVVPSAIRVEADEVTYNLHILVRYEVERLLVSGELTVAEVPAAFAERMERYLGVRLRDDLEGALQDIHWAVGAIASFPSYTVGNLLAAMIVRRLEGEYAHLWKDIERGDFEVLRSWLSQHLWRHGAVYTMAEWCAEELGGPLTAGPYLEYLEQKYQALYGRG